jgi:hypothetical protein
LALHNFLQNSICFYFNLLNLKGQRKIRPAFKRRIFTKVYFPKNSLRASGQGRKGGSLVFSKIEYFGRLAGRGK